MSLRNIIFPEENPFYKIKFRHTWGWLILFGLGIGLQLMLLSNYRKFDIKDPFIYLILGFLTYLFTCAWIWRKIETLQGNPRRLIGKIPQKTQWRSFVTLIICRILFGIGSGILIYSAIALIYPLFTEAKLSEIFKASESKIIQPWLYSTLRIVFVAPSIMLGQFYLEGFLLHRWSTKWGVKKALLAFCFLSAISGFPNILAATSNILVYSLLYIKTRTLIIPILAQFLEFIILRIYWQLLPVYIFSKNISLLEGFQSLWWLGAIMVLLSLPYLANFVYKNWKLTTEENLPYFANASEY
jgi:uncharacterized protein